MKWVKASERKPSKADKTSVDAYGCVIARRLWLVSDAGWVACRHRIENLPDDYEWLEGWNDFTK
jgi:hypothetical protein